MTKLKKSLETVLLGCNCHEVVPSNWLLLSAGKITIGTAFVYILRVLFLSGYTAHDAYDLCWFHAKRRKMIEEKETEAFSYNNSYEILSLLATK